jgi:hypothetical protein
MSKRDHDTEIWGEDWFLSLTETEMLFWFYIKDKCDHAGFWRPNFLNFENLTKKRVNKEVFLQKINSDKERVKVLENGRWFLCGFISFQYCGKLNLLNRFHKSVYETFTKNVSCENTMDYKFEVSLTSNRPQREVNKEQETKNKEQETKQDMKRVKGEEREDAIKDRIEIRSEDFKNSIKPFIEKYSVEMCKAFFEYWSEPNPSKTKMRFELQKTWEISRRLNTWASRQEVKKQQSNFNKPASPQSVSDVYSKGYDNA